MNPHESFQAWRLKFQVVHLSHFAFIRDKRTFRRGDPANEQHVSQSIQEMTRIRSGSFPIWFTSHSWTHSENSVNNCRKLPDRSLPSFWCLLYCNCRLSNSYLQMLEHLRQWSYTAYQTLHLRLTIKNFTFVADKNLLLTTWLRFYLEIWH